MKVYEFTVTLQGIGNDPEEAWTDACECFSREPGDHDTFRELPADEAAGILPDDYQRTE